MAALAPWWQRGGEIIGRAGGYPRCGQSRAGPGLQGGAMR